MAYVPLVAYAGAAMAFFVGSAVAIQRRRIRPGGLVHVAMLGFCGVFANRFMRVLDYMGRDDLGSGAGAAPGTMRAEAEFLVAFFSSLSVGLAFVVCLHALMTRSGFGP